MRRITAAFMIVVFTFISIAQAAGNRPDPETATFSKVRWMKPNGDKAKEVKVRLRFEPEKVLVLNKKSSLIILEIPYSEIRNLTYSRSKHPRWKTGLVAVALVGVFAAPLFFMKGKKHWLTVMEEKDAFAFRLDKKNYNEVVREFEAKTGQQADWIEE